MSTLFTCDDKPTLVAYLYGELDAPMRDRVDEHLATCERCAAEVSALGDVRARAGTVGPAGRGARLQHHQDIGTAIGNGAAAGAVVEHGARVGASRRGRARDRRRRRHREPAGAHPARTASR